MAFRFTWKQKTMGLWVALGLLAIAAVRLTVPTTAAEYNRYRATLAAEKSGSSFKGLGADSLRTLIGSNERYVLPDTAALKRSRERVLAYAFELCDNGRLRVVDVLPSRTWTAANHCVQQTSCTVSGEFREVLLLLQALARKGEGGRIVHVHFETKLDRNRKLNALHSTFIIQYVSRI